MRNLSSPVIYGLLTAGALIAYFLILSIFGLHTNPAYGIFNLVLHGGGIYLAVTKYKHESGPKFKFRKGFMVGLSTGWIATAVFTAFFAIYMSELNPGFQEELITMWETDWFINAGMIIATVALMGFAATFPLTYIWVQLYKATQNTSEGKKHTY